MQPDWAVFKVPGYNFFYTINPKIWWMLDFFKNIEILSKTVVATFWATFGNNCATFYSKIWSHWHLPRCSPYNEVSEMNKVAKALIAVYLSIFRTVFSSGIWKLRSSPVRARNGWLGQERSWSRYDIAQRQCDLIRQFLKFSATNVQSKVTQIFGDFFGHFEMLYFQEKTDVVTFWATLET